MPDVCLTEYTDPGCPYAWSAEPFPAPPAVALRPRHRVAHPDGRPRRHAAGVPRPGHDAREAGVVVRAAVPRARDADGHARAPADGRDAPGLPRGGRRPPARRRAGVPAPAARAARPPLLRRAARRGPDDRRRRGRRGPAADDVLRWCEEPDVARALEEDMAAAREPMPARARPGPQARQLERRAPLHLPEHRDDPPLRPREDLHPGLPAVRRLRRRAGQPRPRHRAPRAARVRRGGPRLAGEPLASQEVAELLGVSRDEAREPSPMSPPSSRSATTGSGRCRATAGPRAPASAEASGTATSASPSSSSA